MVRRVLKLDPGRQAAWKNGAAFSWRELEVHLEDAVNERDGGEGFSNAELIAVDRRVEEFAG